MTVNQTVSDAAFTPVVHLEQLEPYRPPLHHVTVDRRLLPGASGVGIDMIHGTLESGGRADRHARPNEWQMILLLDASGLNHLGNAPEQPISAGSMLRLTPDTSPLFTVTGDRPTKVIAFYSPPLGPESFLRLEDGHVA